MPEPSKPVPADDPPTPDAPLPPIAADDLPLSIVVNGFSSPVPADDPSTPDAPSRHMLHDGTLGNQPEGQPNDEPEGQPVGQLQIPSPPSIRRRLTF